MRVNWQNVYMRSMRACNNPFAYLGLIPFAGCLRRKLCVNKSVPNSLTGLQEHSVYAKYDVARIPWDMKKLAEEIKHCKVIDPKTIEVPHFSGSVVHLHYTR